MDGFAYRVANSLANDPAIAIELGNCTHVLTAKTAMQLARRIYDLMPPGFQDIMEGETCRPLFWASQHQLEHWIREGYREREARTEWKIRYGERVDWADGNN